MTSGPRQPNVRDDGAVTLRALIEDYLRTCDGWREHPEHDRTYMQWEDLRMTGKPAHRTVPTDLAAVRQMAYETTA